MKPLFHSRSTRGTTLIELSVTIAVILILVGTASLCIKPYYDYRDGRAAGETLQMVNAARLMYLSDHPATDLANLTQADLLPYIPNTNGVWPLLPPINGIRPTIDFTHFRVVSTLDPSPSTTDGLWDIGQ
jgi:prepilin-type N-terminal cleavage/methylation domain-containing protein